MKTKLISLMMFVLLLANTLTILTDVVPISLAQDVQFEVLDETGTHFELQYFNIFITTNTTVHIMLRACSEIISFGIENASNATSTQLTLGTLQPSTTYYMYEDGYENEKALMTDNAGSYTYNQDLSQLHYIIIQPASGTITIYESTTLQSNIYETVSIGANNIVLDLNGYSIIGSGGYTNWLGIFLWHRNNVTIKNGSIKNFMLGIGVGDSTDTVICNNTITSNLWVGIDLAYYCHSIMIENNTITSNSVDLSRVSNNNIYHNNFINSGVRVYGGCYANVWDDGYPSGGNYWSDYAGVDEKCGPDQNLPGSDAIGDTPRTISVSDEDGYPLMSHWTSDSSMVSTMVKKGSEWYPLSMVSNSTISDVKVIPGKLDFTVAGEFGTSGYVRAVVPVGLNTTEMKVFLNHTMIDLPYPIIAGNGTHYFVYFAFEFKSFYEVTILLAPIPATIDIDPDTLNLKSNGQWITAYIELPEGYDVANIDVNSIALTVEGQDFTVDPAASTAIGDYDGDGISDLMVKFDRAAIRDHLGVVDIDDGDKFYDITPTVTGNIAGTPFEGSDTITVKRG